MLILFILTSVEMYVLGAVAAAAVIALCVKPSAKGEARQFLLAGILCEYGETETNINSNADQSVSLDCLDDGNVLLTRSGMTGLTDNGAFSLAVTITGFDITVEERIVYKDGGMPVNTALFTLDFLGHERYHVRYVSEQTSLAVAFSLHNRPGMHVSRTLQLNS